MYNNWVNILKPSYIIFGVFLSFSVFLLFYKLGDTYLVNWDEAWFASVANEMLKRGDFITPYWNGHKWFYEPPLLTWVLGVVLSFSDSHFWLRFFNAFCALLLVALTYIFGWRISKNHLGGYFSAIVLLSNIEFLFRARQINTEIPLSLFLTLALFSSYLVVYSKKKIYILLTFITLALAVLTKRATVLLSLPAILYSFYPKSAQLISSKYTKLGIVIFVMIALPWYVANLVIWKLNFFNSFFLNKTFYQVLGVSDIVGSSPIFYFKSLAYAFKFFFPVFAVGGIWIIYKSIKETIFRPILIYCAVFIMVLSIVPLKASWYMLPAYPVFAVVGGAFILNLAEYFNKIKILLVFLVTLIALFQIFNWRSQFIVPDTSGRQAKMAILAKNLTEPNETIYLDDFWSTVATYYSERNVLFLRQNRIRDIVTYSKFPKGAYILTNIETFDEMKDKTGQNFEIIKKDEDLLLVRS